MASGDRLAVFPSRANHVLLKQRLISAGKGLNLLKRKRDALELRLREINSEMQRDQGQMYRVMRAAIFSIAKAKYLCTDFKPATVMNVERADIFMTIEMTKVVGVMLPTFKLTMRQFTSSFPLTGLAHGGEQVELIRKKFQEALKLLISIASLKYSAKMLQEAVKQNNKRVNGLEFVVMPKISNTVNYIRDELDEFEREDFYRLKRSQAKQKVAKQKFRDMIKQKALAHQTKAAEGDTIEDTGEAITDAEEDQANRDFEMAGASQEEGEGPQPNVETENPPEVDE